MQVVGRSPHIAQDAGATATVTMAHQVAATASPQPTADILEPQGAATLTPEASAQASELVALLDELRGVARAQGEDFPPLVQGPSYGLTNGSLAVPLDKALERARGYGIKQPRDFVLGEVAVQLGRARLGYDRTDNRIRQSAGLRLLVELVETVHAARQTMARYPGLAAPVRSHVTTIWSAMADNTKASGSEAIRSFMLTCLSKGLGDLKPPTAKLDEHSTKVIEAAAELFDELTAPLTKSEQEALDQARSDADSRAAKRIERVCAELLPYFGELVLMAMPEEKAKTTETRTLVSAEEARARNEKRAEARRAGSSKANVESAKAESERVISGIKHHDLASRWPNPAAPTPSDIQAAIETLVDRGVVTRPAQLDLVVGFVLRSAQANPLTRPSFGVRSAVSSAEPPWSLRYMRQLTGPDFDELLDATVAKVATRDLDEPQRPGGLGRIFDDRSRSNEAQDWVSGATPRIEDLKGMTRIAGELRRHDGVTAQVAQRLQDLQREIMESFDECRRLAGRLAKNFTATDSRDFAATRARIETLFTKHEATIATLRNVSTESGTFKRLLRMTVGSQSALQIDGLMNGIGRVLDAQAPARTYLAELFARFPAATAPLAEVLGPRLDWFDTAVVKAGSSRQSDPLLPIFDGAWLGTVTAELCRAERTASRICELVDTLPEAVRSRMMVEIDSEEALRGAMLESAARSLAERLGVRPSNVNTTAFDVAAVHSRPLPALAARPRLGYLCAARGILQAPIGDLAEIDRFATLALSDGRGPAYSIDQEQRRELEATSAGRGDYNFWCRTFDLDAPPRSFLNELIGWRTYHAASLEEIVARSEAQAGDDTNNTLGEIAQLGSGTHPIPELEGRELGDRLGRVDAIARRLATNFQALADLTPLLDASVQPVAVLLHAARVLPRAKDKEAAVTLAQPWLRLPDARLREAARKCIAEIRQLDATALMTEHLADGSDRLARLLTMNDVAGMAKATWALGPLEALTHDDDGVVRAFAAYALATIAINARESAANDAGSVLVRLLGQNDAHVVEMACDGLRTLAENGNAFTAKLVIEWVTRNRPHPYVAGLLEQIGESPTLIDTVKVQARGAHAQLVAKLGSAGVRAPRSPVRNKLKSRQVSQRDLSDTMLSAARVARGEPVLEAVSDRLKLALRLVSKFEHWTSTLGPELRGLLDTLDYPDAIVDDAIAELTGKEPRGYLASCPELVSALFSSPDFSAAEICVLESGRIPESLADLASHPLAEDGSWRTVKLAEAFKNEERFSALVKLKLALSSDLPQLVGEVLATILDEKTPRTMAGIAYDAISDVLGVDIPFLNPKLDAAQRKEALANAEPLDPAIDALVERAVVDRLAVVEPTSDEAKALVQYLASGVPEVAQRRLADAIDRATSAPQARLLLEPARALARLRPTSVDAKAPWLINVLRAAKMASIDQIITVRDARRAAVAASDAASAALAGERVATLAAAVMDKRETIPADQLAPLLAIMADSEDDASRQAKFDGLREIMANKDVPWTPERMNALRNGLLVVQANHRYTAIERSLEQAIRFAGRLLDANRGLSEVDLGKHFEILARCSDMTAKSQYADNVVAMYRALSASNSTLSPVFIEQLGLWVAAADAGTGTLSDHDRKREVILRSLVELLPLSDETITQLVQSCAAMSLDRTAAVFRACKEHIRSALLTADDVKRITSDGANPEEGLRFFDRVFGSRVSLLRWKPSALSSFNDPLKDAWNDSSDVKDAKRAMRRSLGNFFDTLAAPRGQTADVEQVAISNYVGTFAFGAWSRGEDRATSGERAKVSGQSDRSTVLSSADYAAHKANSDRIEAAARARILDGKHPVERLSAMMMPNSVAIANAFDGFFTTTIDTEWESAAEGPRVNVNRMILADLNRAHAVKMAEEAEARGEVVSVSVPNVDVCEAPREIETETKNVRLLINVVIDNSGSTDTKNDAGETRLGYFKQLAVMMLNAFGAVENLELNSSVISFSDYGHLLMAPSRKHDIKTMCQALGPIAAHGGTNMADGLDKSRLAASTGTYDKVIHIVLTDGQPNRLGDTQAAVATLRGMGHVVVGFGVGPDALHLGNVFGDEHAISESNPDMIAGRVYNYLKEVVSRVAS